MGVAVAATACQPGAPPPGPVPPSSPERPVEPPEPPAPTVVRIGLLMPSSGTSDLAEYAVLIREGVDLAVAQYDSAGGLPVEVLAGDDGGNALQAARALDTLESEGVLAVIGPLMSDALDAAVASRRDSDLVVLSPTASAEPGVAHAYSLNATDAQGAVALARWALASGMRRLAVLYSTTADDVARTRAFTDAAKAAGQSVVEQVPFDPGTTTFEVPITRLVASEPQAVYVTASARDLRQLVPQLAYYGLTGIQILGSEAWIEPQVLRSLPQPAVEGVVVATPLPAGNGSTGWSDFVALYESTYRRTLDNPYPALGYDAAKLILREVTRGHVRPAELAAALDEVRDYRGATGVLSIENGHVARRPFLVRIRAGQPEPLPFPGRRE